MFAARITDGGNLAFAQRMTFSHNTNVTISKQGLHPQLRSCRLLYHPGFQINGPVAKWRAVFVGLLHEAQPHARSFLADALNERRPEIFHKAFAGPQGERSDELLEVELLSRAENGFCVPNEQANSFAKFE